MTEPRTRTERVLGPIPRPRGIPHLVLWIASLAVLLGGAAAGSVAGTTTSSAPAATGHVPLLPTSPLQIQGATPGGKSSNATQTSLDWAGYAVSGTTFTNVAGSWTQPGASCPSNQVQQAAFWVGLDGLAASDPTVEQIGTDSDCTKGKGRRAGGPSYYAWYQLYPASVVILPSSTYPVAPGDPVSASVSVSGSVFTLTISDGARWRFSTNQHAPGATQRSSAEWIAEAPSSCAARCKVLPLADFGAVGFAGASADHLAISSPAFTNDRIDMTNKSGKRTKALTSALGSGGTAFSVSWLRST